MLLTLSYPTALGEFAPLRNTAANARLMRINRHIVQ